MLRRMADDREAWELLEIGPVILARAESIVREVALRALDAIHVASALTFIEGTARHLPFVAADFGQRVAAERVNLEVVWVA